MEQHRHLHLPPRLGPVEHLAQSGGGGVHVPRPAAADGVEVGVVDLQEAPAGAEQGQVRRQSARRTISGVVFGQHPPAGERAVAGRNVHRLLGGQVNHPARRRLGERRVEAARPACPAEPGRPSRWTPDGVVRAHQDLGLRTLRVVAGGHQFVGDLGNHELLFSGASVERDRGPDQHRADHAPRRDAGGQLRQEFVVPLHPRDGERRRHAA